MLRSMRGEASLNLDQVTKEASLRRDVALADKDGE